MSKKINLEQIRPANPFKEDQMSTFGKARNMLIRQYNFPTEYDLEKDSLMGGDFDLLTAGDKMNDLLKSHEITQMNTYRRFREKDCEELLRLFERIFSLNDSKEAKAIGFRITGSVISGHQYFHLQLFNKGADSETEVYTGDSNPGVIGG
jgi:hypothetical protein